MAIGFGDGWNCLGDQQVSQSGGKGVKLPTIINIQPNPTILVIELVNDNNVRGVQASREGDLLFEVIVNRVSSVGTAAPCWRGSRRRSQFKL